MIAVSKPRDDQSGRPRQNGWRLLVQRQGKVVLVFLLSLILLAYHIIFAEDDPTSSNYQQDATSSHQNLHVLIPASRPDVNLCKALLALGVLGYPAPVIINWNQPFDDSRFVEGGSHLAKITGVHDYIAALDASHDDDLVLMIDGYDVWLQLRPQTLLERYFDINRRANERLEGSLGKATLTEHRIRQDIVFGCQKRCWPWTFDDPPCYAVPNSTLPEDIFGDRTDTPSADGEWPYVNNRPRFLVSGTAIGPVSAFRRLFDQARKQLDVESNFGSDQFIFSHIFGDQEVWREAMRRDAGGTGHPRFNDRHVEEVREKASKTSHGTFEFGIGIDYGSEIVLNTVFAEEDTAWLHVGDRDTVAQTQDEFKVPSQNRWSNLSSFIANSLPPFWTFSQENVPRWTAWLDVPLFTNVFTGIQPVIIHHNAHREGLKKLRQIWWPELWFQPSARTLFDAHIYAPSIPVAQVGQNVYWPYEIWKGGARDGNATVGLPGDGWIRFDDICREHHEELFRDGKGPWELPEAH